MKNIIPICLIILIAASICLAQPAGNNSTASTEIIKVEAQTGKGFSYPYYLYVPAALRQTKMQKQTRALLVIPNNSGKINDELSFHEEDVKKRISQNGAILNKMNITVLMPVFPRPAKDSRIYTHSLDRDVMLTDRKEYRRLDLQLAAMIDHAQAKLDAEKIKTERQVLMMGYSASGMFVNRFVFLHPARVKAAIIGAPGGWALAPTANYKQKNLTFPVGTSDFKEVSGRKFDLKKVRKVPLFLILGEKDTNDAVPMGDAYDERESALVLELFGKTPVERWAKTESLYRENKLNATFKLYPDATHAVTKEMRDDMISFLAKYAR
jgi:dienelactone hydrolase